jgi:hypothetical protein
MRTLTTRRTASGHSTTAAIARRRSTAARATGWLLGAIAVVALGLGAPAAHAGHTPQARHAVVADDMGPTYPSSQPITGTASA